MSGTTGDGADGIAGRDDPARRAARMHGVGDPSDEALLAGMAAGDEAAALAFVRRHQRRVVGLARAIVGDGARAEDVGQEAFVRVWRHAEAYDARRASVSTWLLGITRNAAIDAMRVEQARPAIPVDVLAGTIDLTDRGLRPEDAAVRADLFARAAAAVRRLSDEQRRALLLAALAGRTAAEISELEGIPLGTAKTRIRSALIRLRNDLAEEFSR